MGQQAASINQAILGGTDTAVTNTLNATPTGSSDTSIFRFNADPADTDAFTITTTAAGGTIILITQPGIYHVTLDFVFDGAVLIAAGISFGASTAVAIVADPVVNVANVIVSADVDGNANGDQPVHLEAIFEVTEAAAVLARAASTAVATARVMFHGTNSGGAAPAGITAAGAQYSIEKIAQSNR